MRQLGDLAVLLGSLLLFSLAFLIPGLMDWTMTALVGGMIIGFPFLIWKLRHVGSVLPVWPGVYMGVVGAMMSALAVGTVGPKGWSLMRVMNVIFYGEVFVVGAVYCAGYGLGVGRNGRQESRRRRKRLRRHAKGGGGRI